MMPEPTTISGEPSLQRSFVSRLHIVICQCSWRLSPGVGRQRAHGRRDQLADHVGGLAIRADIDDLVRRTADHREARADRATMSGS